MTSARGFTGISDVGSFISEASQPPPQLNIPSEPPLASDNALVFIKELNESDFTYALFEDTLSTVNDFGSEVGQYTVKVSPGDKWGYPCYLVEANSQGIIEGIPCGTSVKSYVASNLETIYQEHTEYVKLTNQPVDRRTIIKRTSNGYDVTKTVTQGSKKEEFHRLFEFGAMEGFISEGANILLLRILITKAMPSYFEVISFDSDTNLSLATYKALGEQEQMVGHASVHVVGVERTIHSLTDLPTSWQTFHMTDGHLICRAQVGSPVSMRVKVAPTLIEPDEHIPKPIIPKKKLNIDEDMELHSKFIDLKESTKADYMLYMRDHPQLQAMISDFLQELVVNKPEDVIQFGQQYFSTFSSRREVNHDLE